MIGSKLKAARNALNLTQEEVAEKIQISRQTLSNWENEKTYPDIINIVKLSDLYQVSLDSLLKDDQKTLEQMEMRRDIMKTNRRLLLIWVLCPLIFLTVNLFVGGITIGKDYFGIHGPAFFITLFLAMAITLISFVITLVGLLKKRNAVVNSREQRKVNSSDILRLSMLTSFLLSELLIFLWML